MYCQIFVMPYACKNLGIGPGDKLGPPLVTIMQRCTVIIVKLFSWLFACIVNVGEAPFIPPWHPMKWFTKFFPDKGNYKEAQ